ncbi:MAG: YegS/Rv2252/BmrU family lipid kinase [Rhodospirillaceae bacterium]|nr:YegS/Rv2252/BmrU family lipid kinase [Rhodospirillaceae bacterium]
MDKKLFIINPAGFGGFTTDVWHEFLSLWGKEILPEHIYVTTGPGDARKKAASCDNFDVIVAVGGDGTIGEVASGIMDKIKNNPSVKIPALAAIPGGAGNDVCRALGISSVAQAVDAILANKQKPYDLILVDCMNGQEKVQRHAMMFANVGFPSNALATPFLKRLLGGRLAYHFAIFLKLLVHKPPTLSFNGGGRIFNEAKWTILIANIERAGGGGVCLAPGSRYNDGEMKITVVPKRNKLAMLLKVLPKIAAGKHINEPGFDFFSAREATVLAQSKCVLEIDGDTFGETPVTFTHCPGAINVVCCN